MKKQIYMASTLLLAGAGAALANGTHSGAHGKPAMFQIETDFGSTGNPKEVNKTIKLEMSDEMKFLPNTFVVNQGDTVKFVISNKGEVQHEMVIGTKPGLLKHAALMEKFPNMEHGDPFMTHVEPKQTGAIYWKFDKPGKFQFGCLVPGHFNAGMRGTVKVRAANPDAVASTTPIETVPASTVAAVAGTEQPPTTTDAAKGSKKTKSAYARKKAKADNSNWSWSFFN